MNENSVTKPIVFKINTLSKLRSPIMKGSHNKVAISHTKNQDATSRHFNQPGHTLGNMNITILERVKSNYPINRKEREVLCQKFNC